MLLAVLTPPPPPAAQAAPPAAMPLGRAALALESRGAAQVAFVSGVSADGELTGVAVDGAQAWRPVRLAPTQVDAVYDRYPSQRDPDGFRALQVALGERRPWANAPRAVALCRDKLASQRVLEARGVAMPDLVETCDGRAAQALADWGAGFVKPRYGAFGVGVERVAAGAQLAAERPGLVGLEPALLQRAVEGPARLRLPDGTPCVALSIRALVQRDASGAFVPAVAVARVSSTEAVVNVERGAQVVPLDALLAANAQAPAGVAAAVDATALDAAAAIASALGGAEALVELGVDVVLDAGWRPWVIEVNGKPAGHLGALARRWPERFGAAHAEACARPLAWLSRGAARWPASPSTR